MQPVPPNSQLDQEEKAPENIIVSVKFLKVLGTLIFLVVLFGGALSYFKGKLDDIPKTYDECVKRTGSRLQESMPAICISLEGNYFIQPLTDENGVPLFLTPTPIVGVNTPVPTQPQPKQCKRAGCSGQLCLDITAEDVLTTCEFRAEYTCYQSAPCEVQPSGECGFTDSPALQTCLQEKNSAPILNQPL